MRTDEEIISRLEQEKLSELGELLEQQKALIMGMPSTQFAKVISQELKLNYGASLCLTFWIEELLKMSADFPQDKKVYSSLRNRQRTIHLNRLIQVVGAGKALNYCLSKVPEHVRDDLKATWGF